MKNMGGSVHLLPTIPVNSGCPNEGGECNVLVVCVDLLVIGRDDRRQGFGRFTHPADQVCTPAAPPLLVVDQSCYNLPFLTIPQDLRYTIRSESALN